MKPKLSVITVSYNSETTLERTIKSVLRQKYDNIEYIIIDGGSTDGTVEIIRKYEAYITYWITEPDNGISDAFNKGIKVATGDLIWIINSDDGILNGAVDYLVDHYDPSIDVYRGRTRIVTIDGKEFEYEPSMKINCLGTININHPSTVISKRAYEKFGLYDIKCKNYMDLDILLRMYRGRAEFRYIDYTLAFFSWGGATASEFTKKRKDELNYVLKKNGFSDRDVWVAQSIRKVKRGIKNVLGFNNVSKLWAYMMKNK